MYRKNASKGKEAVNGPLLTYVLQHTFLLLYLGRVHQHGLYRIVSMRRIFEQISMTDEWGNCLLSLSLLRTSRRNRNPETHEIFCRKIPNFD